MKGGMKTKEGGNKGKTTAKNKPKEKDFGKLEPEVDSLNETLNGMQTGGVNNSLLSANGKSELLMRIIENADEELEENSMKKGHNKSLGELLKEMVSDIEGVTREVVKKYIKHTLNGMTELIDKAVNEKVAERMETEKINLKQDIDKKFEEVSEKMENKYKNLNSKIDEKLEEIRLTLGRLIGLREDVEDMSKKLNEI